MIDDTVIYTDNLFLIMALLMIDLIIFLIIDITDSITYILILIIYNHINDG